MRVPKFVVAAVFALAVFALIAQAALAQRRGSDTRSEALSVVRAHVQGMTLRQKIGQVCMMNFRYFSESGAGAGGAALSAEAPQKFASVNQINPTIKSVVSDYNIGAVILFAENLREEGAAKKFIRDLNSAALASGLPLLFGVDQEGGNVNRLPDFEMPSAMALKRCGNLENAFLVGEANGRLLLDYGIHCNFAPVCDIASNPENPVIGIRAFSDDKNYVAEFSNAMQKGIKNAGAIPCAKHFPGHGDTSSDSHLLLPQVKTGFSQWKIREAVPFIKNIQNKIPMIMTAHIQMPAMDSSTVKADKTGEEIVVPATFSNKIIMKILRGSLGFDGIVVSDAMDMNAISENFSPSRAFVLAVNAGVNLVCNPISVQSKGDLARLEQFFSEVENAALDGTLNIKMLDDSVERLLLLKTEYALTKIEDGRLIAAEQKIVPMDARAKKEAAELSRKIQSLVTRFTYKNRISPKKNILVLTPRAQKSAFVKKYFAELGASGSGRAGDTNGGTAGSGTARNSAGIVAEVFSYEGKSVVSAALQKKIKFADTIIIFTQLSGYGVKDSAHWQAAFPREAARLAEEAGKAGVTVAVSTELPYDAESFPAQKGFGFCATYNYNEEAYKIALDEILSL